MKVSRIQINGTNDVAKSFCDNVWKVIYCKFFCMKQLLLLDVLIICDGNLIEFCRKLFHTLFDCKLLNSTSTSDCISTASHNIMTDRQHILNTYFFFYFTFYNPLHFYLVTHIVLIYSFFFCLT